MGSVGINNAAKITLVDGRPLKSILKKPRVPKDIGSVVAAGVYSKPAVGANRPTAGACAKSAGVANSPLKGYKPAGVAGNDKINETQHVEGKRKVSMEENTTVWEVETDFASPVRPAWADAVGGVENDIDAGFKPNGEPQLTPHAGNSMHGSDGCAGTNMGLFGTGNGSNNDGFAACFAADVSHNNEAAGGAANQPTVEVVDEHVSPIAASNAVHPIQTPFAYNHDRYMHVSDTGGESALNKDGALKQATFADMFNQAKLPEEMPKKLNFKSFVNMEKVDNFDIVLPQDAIEKVKSKYENTLVCYFIGKSLAFPIVQNYVNNTWGKFWIRKLMRNDDGVFLFKFADKTGMEQVLERGPWLIRNTPLILNKWTPTSSLKKDEVTKVPVWVKLHKVPLVAYLGDGLSLIATQIGKPIMLDALTSSMCEDPWGRINYARALVDISADTILKQEVSMAIPMEDGIEYTKEVIRVEYDWKPPHCVDFSSRKNKGKKVDNNQPETRPVSDIRLNTPKSSFYDPVTKHVTNKRGADPMVQVVANATSTSNSFDVIKNVDEGDECGVFSSTCIQEEEQEAGYATASKYKSSMWEEESESDDEVDEVLFPEGD
ncbi:hypothetical protein Tco_1370642 [Tanacetum coccineum]